MPRRAFLAIPGIPWHIIQRGNSSSACFYAYVLMTNHVHLLLTPAKEESAALLMKHLCQRYVQYINRTYRRSGTLWEGRFRPCLAHDDKCHETVVCPRFFWAAGCAPDAWP